MGDTYTDKQKLMEIYAYGQKYPTANLSEILSFAGITEFYYDAIIYPSVQEAQLEAYKQQDPFRDITRKYDRFGTLNNFKTY